jgi:hypothetical protein
VVYRVPTLGNTDRALDFDEDLTSLGVNSFDYIRMVWLLEQIPPLFLEHADISRSMSQSLSSELQKRSLRSLSAGQAQS